MPGITNISLNKTVTVSLNKAMPFALRNSIVGDTEAMELSWACIFQIVSCASRRFLLISVYIDVQLYGSVICLTWEMASWKCFEKLVFEIHINFRSVAWNFEGVRKGEKVRREPFSIYGGEETMHLLMTTYRQDVMPIFQGSFSKSVYISVLALSTEVFMLKNNFTTVSFKFSLILI